MDGFYGAALVFEIRRLETLFGFFFGGERGREFSLDNNRRSAFADDGDIRSFAGAVSDDFGVFWLCLAVGKHSVQELGQGRC